MEGEAVRLREPHRTQLILKSEDLDSLIEQDHPARAIWRVLEGMDLAQFYAKIKARAGSAGRDATDPKMLLALWVYGLSEGVNSARELERLCEAHAAYRWICGGVSVNYHTLSDFRSWSGAGLDELMTQVLAVLMHKRLVKLYRVAQDGTRVRASAGSASFRRKPSLQRCLEQARAHVAKLAQEAESAPGARAEAARQRAVREHQERIEQALYELEQLSAAKAKSKNHSQRKGEVRASSTDPQARIMKLANGGYAPAYNLQFATDTESRIIVGVRASNAGADNDQMEPMQDEIARRTGVTPRQHLADGGYLNYAAVERSAARGIEVFSPPRASYADPAQPSPGREMNTPAINQYRKRMASPEGLQIYTQRAATAETVNADLKTWRGLDRLLVRGLNKVLTVALWSALTYNLLRAIKMRWL